MVQIGRSNIVLFAMFIASTSIAKEQIDPQCRNAGDELAQVRCSIAASKRRTENFEETARNADKQSAKSRADAKAARADAKAAEAEALAAEKQKMELQKQIEASNKRKACTEGVQRDIFAAKELSPLQPEQIEAFKLRIVNCEKT